MKKLSEIILFALIARLLNLICKTLGWSYRVEVSGEHNRDLVKQGSEKGGYLLACWHETVLTVSQHQKGIPFCALCSLSSIGQAVAYMMRQMGFHPISGSRTRGGKEARDEILEFLDKGVPTAITVDGSKGPRRYVKPGIIDLAKKGGVQILPVFTLPDRKWIFNSWDRFRLPKPFAKVIIVYGEPIEIPADIKSEEYESYQEIVKQKLDLLEAKATEMMAGATA